MNRDGRQLARMARRSALALACVALIFAGQLIAVTHWHPIAQHERVNVRAELTSDGGLCAICLLAFHASANPTTTPAFAAPTLALGFTAASSAGALHSFDPASVLTRAPPHAA
jgi:hypothetical protein